MKKIIFISQMFVAGFLFAQTQNEQNAKSYSAHGIVEKISPDLRQVTIHHDAIPGYMMSMTMDFAVKNTNELNGISPNDEITFKLAVGTNESWVENIRFESHRIANSTNNTFVIHESSAELKIGDILPDCEFTSEKGNQFRLSDFRGKAVAFTFFYSRCPLPDYCPRMNQNFSDARNLLLADTNAPPNWQLLCISFDPLFDSPEALTYYANFYRGTNTDQWLYAVASTNTLSKLAPRLDLMIMRDGDNVMSHNLRTVVLDPRGRIFKQLDGNQWTPQELAGAMVQAAHASSQ